MLRGIYTAASAMINNLVATDTRANNMANVATTGFKRSGVNFQGFQDLLIHRLAGGTDQTIGTLPNASQIKGTPINFSQGTLQQTGNPLDVAIEGEGFLAVQLPGGETAYTRNGNLTMDDQGFLTTIDGHRVQGRGGGDIQIPTGATVQISDKGQITANGQLVDTLNVVRFENNNALHKVGDTLFQTSATPEPAENYRVHQGNLEGSNVNPISELVNSLAGMRLYESLQKNIHVHNDTLGKAVNDVGRYR